MHERDPLPESGTSHFEDGRNYSKVRWRFFAVGIGFLLIGLFVYFANDPSSLSVKQTFLFFGIIALIPIGVSMIFIVDDQVRAAITLNWDDRSITMRKCYQDNWYLKYGTQRVVTKNMSELIRIEESSHDQIFLKIVFTKGTAWASDVYGDFDELRRCFEAIAQVNNVPYVYNSSFKSGVIILFLCVVVIPIACILLLLVLHWLDTRMLGLT